jgi:uncharacterized protein (TIGR02598 family)
MKRFPPLSGCFGAFTLIEVTIALGISSFAILSILGVMAVGMRTMGGAVDATVQAQITNDVVGNLKQVNFTELTKAGSSLAWRYDDRGLSVGNTGTAEEVYSASAEILPATLSGGSANPNLVRVSILISKISEPARPYIFSTFIANNGQ